MSGPTARGGVEPAESRYAVVGQPVEHSQSPFIHAAFARQTAQAMRYERLPAAAGAFAATVAAFADGGASGCNVTLPFKFEAFARAARHTPRALRAGACNTLRFDAEGWLGDNTDGAGLVRDIERNAVVALAGARVLLIGAGGAAAGVLGPLLDAGASAVVIANRTASRADALRRSHAAAEPAWAGRIAVAALNDCGAAFDVVVNASASSVAGAPVPVAPIVLRRGTLAVDLMYGSAARPFVDWARAHGAVGRDGLGMLVEQAAESFLLWRGIEPDTLPVLAELRARLALP